MTEFKDIPTGSFYAGAILGGLGGLTLTEWLAIFGFCLALAGFVTNTWYKISTYRLQKRESEERIKQMNRDEP